jgi:hypothetical protein
MNNWFDNEDSQDHPKSTVRNQIFPIQPASNQPS